VNSIIGSSNSLTHSASMSNLGALRSSSASGFATTTTPTPAAPLHLTPLNVPVHVEASAPQSSPALVKGTSQAPAQPPQQPPHLLGHNQLSANDEELYIEEVRPVPVLTQDLRLQQLHAIMQDHTYASQQQQQPAQAPAGDSTISGTAQQLQQPQQWSLGGIGVTVAGGQPTPTAVGGYCNYFGQQSK